MKKAFIVLASILILFSVSAYPFTQQINFQGKLASSDDTPITISRTVDFKLYDQQQPGGNQIGSTVTKTIIPDSNGNFSVLLDFDPSCFDGSDRYLEIQVQEGGDSAMTPRQLITTVSYAYRAIRVITAESLAGGGQGILSGSATGEILYWNGTQWETVPIGQPGQFLQLSGSNIPFWGWNFTTLTTTALSNITATTASSGGNISSDGGASVTSRGVCWNTSGSPTIDDSKTTNNSGTGIFASSLTGLTAGTTYYVRAYATNSVGTAYGNQLSFTTLFAIGQIYGDGIIFYVDGTGYHGLIAATVDQSAGIQWYNGSYVVTGATGTGLGTGNQNTNTIVSVQGAGSYAAKLCYNAISSPGGYNDWFLPSKDELYQLYLQRAVVGNFTNSYYWSSSEYDLITAWFQDFGYSGQGNNSKYITHPVRAIRAF